MVEYKPEKRTLLAPEELAEAIRDVRVRAYPSLIPGTGLDTQRQKGMETNVRPADIDYAKALLRRININRRNNA